MVRVAGFEVSVFTGGATVGGDSCFLTGSAAGACLTSFLGVVTSASSVMLIFFLTHRLDG